MLNQEFSHGARSGDNKPAPAALDAVDRRGKLRPYDGDGTMLGRVLIYASVIVVAAVMIIWRRNG